MTEMCRNKGHSTTRRWHRLCLIFFAAITAALLSGCNRPASERKTYILRWELDSGETLELRSDSAKVNRLVDACWDEEELFCPEIRDENGRVIMNDMSWQVGMTDDTRRKQYERLRD